MTQIFISHIPADAACAQKIQADLQTLGYTIWASQPHLTPESASYPRMIENGVRSSAATVVVWSAGAARSEWVERALLSAQRLQKPILPIVTDGTDLPATLFDAPQVASQPPCADAVALLLPHLPPPERDDVLLTLSQELAHEYIRVRKAGIRRAAKLLQEDRYREPVLALLEDVARKDLMMTVRELAQAVLDSELHRNSPPSDRETSRHIFGVRCPDGHVTYFDRRRVCPDSGTFVRNVVRRAGAELDEIALECRECGHEMFVTVDCEGYK